MWEEGFGFWWLNDEEKWNHKVWTKICYSRGKTGIGNMSYGAYMVCQELFEGYMVFGSDFGMMVAFKVWKGLGFRGHSMI